MREVRGGLTNILTAGTYLKGNLKADAGVRIDGMVEGEVTVSDTLVLGKTGTVKGTIKTKDALIGGKVIGNIKSQGKVELKTGSIINGDIICKKLAIEEGATFDGLCKMSEEKPGTERKEIPTGKTERIAKS
jgi:cytoskeletal protein CcmA (bactofilin family)